MQHFVKLGIEAVLVNFIGPLSSTGVLLGFTITLNICFMQN